MLRKVLISIGCNLIIFYLTGLSNIWTQEQALENKNLHPLQDQGFKLIAYNQDLIYLNDYLLIGIVLLAVILILFHKKRLEIIFRWSLMLNILFTIRIITVPSTILTRPLEVDVKWLSCKTHDFQYDRFSGPFEILFQDKMTCYDFIYSGHMVNTCIIILLLIKYVKFPFIYVSWIFVPLESYFILATRSHYLIDIEIAVIFTVLFWYLLEYREKLRCYDSISKIGDNSNA